MQRTLPRSKRLAAPRGSRPRVLLPGIAPGGDRCGAVEFGALATVRLEAGGPVRLSGPAGRLALAAGVSAGTDVLAGLEACLAKGSAELSGTGWFGHLSYDLGRVLEPRAAWRARAGGLPLGEFHRVDAAERGAPGLGAFRFAEPARSACGRAGYVGMVTRALEYIRAGDIYQANIAHRLEGRFSGSGAGMYAALARQAAPRHGAYFESAALADGTRYAVASLSPELFLSFDAATRRLTTRPMKGTRPGTSDPRELLDSEKDRAELAMIVDLMRNDLGRVCEFGSVRVDAPREIERHASGPGEVLQATATVSGVVREGLGMAEILRATFPPGSVTGTPKIRAMQVIDELEEFARGPYCGCIGMFGDNGSFELAVAIRTAVIHGPMDEETGDFVNADFSYCVGAGIVADSDPESEWEETLAKAGVLGAVCAIEA